MDKIELAKKLEIGIKELRQGELEVAYVVSNLPMPEKNILGELQDKLFTLVVEEIDEFHSSLCENGKDTRSKK